MFRASRSWASVAGLIDPMHRHMEQLSRNKLRLVGDDGVLVSNYNAIICEMFCLAAAGLASQMKESLLDAGKLWDEIFTTGNNGVSLNTSYRPKTPNINPSLRETDIESVSEKSLQAFDHGRGSLMFLVRHISTHEEAEKLKAEGYRFAEVHQVISNIRSNMQILTPNLLSRLTRMSEVDSSADCEQNPGAYVGAFVLRARLDNNSGGFDVLVQKTVRHRLPMKLLAIQHLRDWHHTYLKQLNGLTVSEIIQRLGSFVRNKTKGDEALFSQQLVNALIKLRDGFAETVSSEGSEISPFDSAILIPQVVQIPCTAEPVDNGWDTSQGQPTCSLLCFRLVLPIHTRDNFKEYQFDPLPFFKTRQLVYPGSQQQVEFSHQIHRDVMASVLQDSSVTTVSKHRRLLERMRALVGWKGKTNAKAAIAMEQLERSSREGLTLSTAPISRTTQDEKSTDLEDRKQSVSSSFATENNDGSSVHLGQLGGIMVSQQVVVDVEARSIPAQNTAVGLTIVSKGRGDMLPPLGNSYTAVATGSGGQHDVAKANGQPANHIFVDQLFRLCISSYVAR